MFDDDEVDDDPFDVLDKHTYIEVYRVESEFMSHVNVFISYDGYDTETDSQHHVSGYEVDSTLEDEAIDELLEKYNNVAEIIFISANDHETDTLKYYLKKGWTKKTQQPILHGDTNEKVYKQSIVNHNYDEMYLLS